MQKLILAIPELCTYGGEEKLVYKLSEHLKTKYDVRILTAKYKKEKTYPFSVPIYNANININNFILKQIAYINYFRKDSYPDYKIIAFGYPSYYLAKKNKNVIWYCNAPNKFIYEHENFKARIPFILRPISNTYVAFMKYIDTKMVHKIKSVIANSENIALKVLKIYGLESKVIYPGVDIINNVPIFNKNLLSVARLYPEKRVDLIVKAMELLPEYHLTVVGDGPELNKLMSIAPKNVTFKSRVDDDELHNLYNTCYVTVYVPIDEDFGLIPVESFAHGKMCIGANEGGLRETITPITGILLDDVSAISIASAVASIKPSEHVNDCKERATKFSFDNYYKQIEEYL